MKKLFLGGIILLSLFLIYLGTMDKKVYYLALGDSFARGTTPYGGEDYGYSDFVSDYLKEKKLLEIYIKEYAVNDYRTTDLKRAIVDNQKVFVEGKEKTLKNALIKADLVTLSIGMNDLLNTFSISNQIPVNQLYDHMDEVVDDLEGLFQLMREYCKEDIVLTGFYDPFHKVELEDPFSYLNSRMKTLCDKYHIVYIDVYHIMQNASYLPNPNSMYPSKEGYQMVGNYIVKELDRTLLRK